MHAVLQLSNALLSRVLSTCPRGVSKPLMMGACNQSNSTQIIMEHILRSKSLLYLLQNKKMAVTHDSHNRMDHVHGKGALNKKGKADTKQTSREIQVTIHIEKRRHRITGLFIQTTLPTKTSTSRFSTMS